MQTLFHMVLVEHDLKLSSISIVYLKHYVVFHYPEKKGYNSNLIYEQELLAAYF